MKPLKKYLRDFLETKNPDLIQAGKKGVENRVQAGISKSQLSSDGGRHT